MKKPVQLGADERAALGANFRAYRKFRRMTTRAFCEKAGICLTTLRVHEKGERMLRADQIVAASTILGISVARLLDLRPPTFMRGSRGKPLAIMPWTDERTSK